MKKSVYVLILLIIASNNLVSAEDKKSPKEIILEEMAESNKFERSVAQSEGEVLERVYASRIRLHKQFKAIGQEFTEPQLFKKLSDINTDAFYQEVFDHFLQEDFIAFSGVMPLDGLDGEDFFFIYHNLYRIEKREKKKLGEIFPDLKTKELEKFSVQGWKDKEVSIVSVGDGLVKLDSIVALASKALGGTYKNGYVIVMVKNIEELKKDITVTHELGHAFVDKALDIHSEIDDKRFTYDGKERALVQFDELFAYFVELKCGGRFLDTIELATGQNYSTIYQYKLTYDIFAQIVADKKCNVDNYNKLSADEQKKVQENIISALENEIFTKILPVVDSTVKHQNVSLP